MALRLPRVGAAETTDRNRDRPAVRLEPHERDRVDQVEDTTTESLQHGVQREQLRCQWGPGCKWLNFRETMQPGGDFAGQNRKILGPKWGDRCQESGHD